MAQKKVKIPCLRLYNSCTSTFIKDNLFPTFNCKYVHECFIAVNSKIYILKKWNKECQTKFGQYQKLFWVKGPNFGVEVIVSAQGVLNCWPLRLWFPELPKLHTWLGIAHSFRALSLFQACWEILDFIWKLNCSILASDHIHSDHFFKIQSASHKELIF